MIAKNYRIREDQIAFLDNLPGNASEHLRAAIDDYMEKKKVKSVPSASKPMRILKGGKEVLHGSI